MNLVDDPWIPVVTKDGRRELWPLRDIYVHGRDAADLDVRPHERVALYRLFLCVAHAALNGPADVAEWCAAPDVLPAAVDTYLTQWKKSFELFDPERPFLQVAVPAKGDTPVTKLDCALASGNNATLFDHAALTPEGRYFSPAELALMLLTNLCFALGGGVSGCDWRGAANKQNFTDAPCCSGSMAHTLLRGENLFHAICLNLCTHASLADHYEHALGAEWLGRPIWETPPLRFMDTEARRNAEGTCLGRLVPLSRAVRLNADCRTMFYEMGFRLKVFPEFPPELTGATALFGKKEEPRYIGLRPQRGIWRDLAAITLHRQSDGGKTVSASRCFDMFSDERDCDIVVGGLAREPGKATVLHCPESVFHLPAGIRLDRGHGIYAEAVEQAEERWRRLAYALSEYKRASGAEQGFGALSRQAEAHYWSALESRLDLAFALVRSQEDQIAFDAARAEWSALLRHSALDAYALVCPASGPRALRAFVLGRQKLLGQNNKNSKQLGGGDDE